MGDTATCPSEPRFLWLFKGIIALPLLGGCQGVNETLA